MTPAPVGGFGFREAKSPARICLAVLFRTPGTCRPGTGSGPVRRCGYSPLSASCSAAAFFALALRILSTAQSTMSAATTTMTTFWKTSA